MKARSVGAGATASEPDAKSRRRGRSRRGSSDPLVVLGLRLLVDQLRRGIVLIDDERGVHYCNPAAARILREDADILRIADGRLEIGSGNVLDRFGRYVNAFRVRPDSVARALALRVDRPDGTRSHRTLISRLDGAAAAARPILAVIVYEAQIVRSMPTVVLTELYGLTRAEAALVAELYAGRTLAAASAAIGIKTNTARTHLKRIFDKCAVRSQAELLQMLALGPRIV